MEEDLSQDDLQQDAQRFGEYEVMRDARGGVLLLGSGSYGRTYKARHVLLGTEVAIKVIRRELTASESTRQRFLREGRALAGLAHDHIAMLRHFGRSDDGQLYYAMDYCGGGTLAERVRQLGPRPAGEALLIIRQVASALAAAHAAGIIHRDLKPGNIMLTHAPPPLRVKVIDFGLALSSGTGAPGGRFHGTAQWASPEQLREQPLDGRSDLFSLGLVLWLLLAGEAPDSGSTGAVVHSRLDSGGYAKRLPPGLPPAIAGLLGKLLEDDPCQRPTAVELLELLDALLQTHPYEPVAEVVAEEHDHDVADLRCLPSDEVNDDRYERLTRLHRDLAGEWFEAELAGGQGSRIVFVLDEHQATNPSLRAKVRANLARIQWQTVDGLPCFSLYYETAESLVAEFTGRSGDNLTSWLRLRRKVELRDALGFLAQVAQTADETVACGLPGLGLQAVQVRWENSGSSDGGGLRGALPRLFPLLLDAGDLPAGDGLSADASGSTLVLASPELACNQTFMLAKLIYRMVSGREAPDAVAHSPGAYIKVSALNEEGNAVLCEALGRSNQWDSCSGLLRGLAEAEKLSITGSGTGRIQPARGSSANDVRTPKPQLQPPVVSTTQPRPVAPEHGGRAPLMRRPLPWIIAACLMLGLGAWAMISYSNTKIEAATSSVKAAKQRAVVAEQELQALAAQTKAKEEAAKKAAELIRTKSAKAEGAKVIKGGEERDFQIAPGVKIRMCWIPPGEFMMGSPAEELERVNDETQHRVTISTGFWLAKTETTQAQWQAVMGNNPSKFKGNDLPVESVSWNDIAGPGGFIERANQSGGTGADGGHFSLPTEAQWEYACRAGTTGAYVGDVNEMAWYDKNSDNQTHPVATKKSNTWGLHDMQGNVTEWCADWYGKYSGGAVTDPLGPASGSFRVGRGGGWYGNTVSCRVANRFSLFPLFGNYHFGFRIARSYSASLAEPEQQAHTMQAKEQEEAARQTAEQQRLAELAKKKANVNKKTKAGEERDFQIAPGVKIRMCWIPPGEFMMGSPVEEFKRRNDETQHRVMISIGFWLAKTETTQAQWQSVMGNNPSYFKGNDLPVESVRWDDIAGPGGFIEKANQSGGTGEDRGRFSLPTEAQWEYACRAGTTGAYVGDVNEMAWYDKNSDNQTHPVATKKSNTWGLNDMQGNVWEWCADWYGDYPGVAVTDPRGPTSGSARVYRGGSWSGNVNSCRVAYRINGYPTGGDNGIGFRVARSSVP